MSSKSSFLKKKPKWRYSKKIENLLKNNIWFNLTCERKKRKKNLSTYFNGKVIVVNNNEIFPVLYLQAISEQQLLLSVLLLGRFNF